MNKYLKESIKYLLRSYPVIYPYVKEVERMYNMSHDELQGRNERVFLKIFRKAYTKSSFYISKHLLRENVYSKLYF